MSDLARLRAAEHNLAAAVSASEAAADDLHVARLAVKQAEARLPRLTSADMEELMAALREDLFPPRRRWLWP